MKFKIIEGGKAAFADGSPPAVMAHVRTIEHYDTVNFVPNPPPEFWWNITENGAVYISRGGPDKGKGVVRSVKFVIAARNGDAS